MLDIIKQLESTSKKSEKEAILKNLHNHDIYVFKKIAFLTYDPSIDFYVKAFNTDVDTHFNCVTLFSALNDLENIIASRTITGNMAKKWIEHQYEMLTKEDAEIFKRVVKRDLKCGISASTINKIFPGTIYEKRYMRCSSFSDKNLKNISFPCYSQVKMDGQYVAIIIENEQVKYRTRNGTYLNIGNTELNIAFLQHCNNSVLEGEVVALTEDLFKFMDRSKSNGYVNSNNVDSDRCVFILWDKLTIKEYNDKVSNVPYNKRWIDISDTVEALDHHQVSLVDSQTCKNIDDVVDHFKVCRKNGEEGTVVKDFSGKWKNGTSKHQVKVKVVFECEMRLIGHKEGTGKHEGLFGSLLFESSDGLVEVSAGIGYKDVDRPFIFKNLQQWIDDGKIATIKANDIVKSDSKPGMKSLFLPRFVEWRDDKTEADSLARIQEQLDSCLDVLKMMGKK